MAETILVTGGAGFIGSYVVEALLAAGDNVRVLDRLEPQVHGAGQKRPAYLAKEAELVVGDVGDRETMRRCLEGVTKVIHLAADVGVGQSQYDIARFTIGNTAATAVLLDVIDIERKDVERLVVASSMSLYGEGPYRRPSDGTVICPPLRGDAQLAARDFEMRDPQTNLVLEPFPTPESKELSCQSIYALNKKDQEEYCLLAGRVHGFKVFAARFFNAYGPRQALSNPYTGAGAIFSSRIRNGNPPLVFEDGHQSRDFVHARDIASAVLFLLRHPTAEPGPYNVCTGKATSILQLAEALAELLGRPDIKPRVTHEFRSGDIRHCIGDPSRLAALGWRASIPLKDGLRELVEWTLGQDSVDKVDSVYEDFVKRGLIKK